MAVLIADSGATKCEWCLIDPGKKPRIVFTQGISPYFLNSQQIEAILGTPVYLDLRVKVAKDWQRDPKQLNRLGF